MSARACTAEKHNPRHHEYLNFLSAAPDTCGLCGEGRLAHPAVLYVEGHCSEAQGRQAAKWQEEERALKAKLEALYSKRAGRVINGWWRWCKCGEKGLTPHSAIDEADCDNCKLRAEEKINASKGGTS